MKLKELLKDLETINKLNLKYNLASKKVLVLSEKDMMNNYLLENVKDIKIINDIFIDKLADELINGEWHKDFDNFYYLEYKDEYNKYCYHLQIKNY